MNIAERIKHIRGKESRDSFAQKIGIHAQTLYRYEQGGRDIDSGVIVSICKGFDISPVWLLFGDGPMRHGEPPQPAEKTPEPPANTPETSSCARCAKMEARMEKMEQQRDELVQENRELWRKNGQLAQENGDLKIEVAVQREQLKSLSGRSVAVDCA